MPLTLTGLVLTLLLAPVPSTAAPQSGKDLAQQIFDVMVQLPGNTPPTVLSMPRGSPAREHLQPQKKPQSFR
jgi:hypothetical protein